MYNNNYEVNTFLKMPWSPYEQNPHLFYWRFISLKQIFFGIGASKIARNVTNKCK